MTPVQVFSSGFWEIFKSTYFVELLRVATSDQPFSEVLSFEFEFVFMALLTIIEENNPHQKDASHLKDNKSAWFSKRGEKT